MGVMILFLVLVAGASLSWGIVMRLERDDTARRFQLYKECIRQERVVGSFLKDERKGW